MSFSATNSQGSEWLAAIADPVRVGIVLALSQCRHATVGELGQLVQTSGQTLRRHLSALAAVGVVEVVPGESDGETSGRPPARFSLNQRVREATSLLLGEPLG